LILSPSTPLQRKENRQAVKNNDNCHIDKRQKQKESVMPFFQDLSAPKFLPRIDLDLRAGRWFDVLRVQNQSGDYETQKTEIEVPFKIQMDLGNCGIGWINFINKMPDSIYYHCKEGMPPQPPKVGDDEYKQSFKIVCRVEGRDDLATFSKQGLTITRALDELVGVWENDERSKDNALIPLVEVTGSESISVGKSNVYQPKWNIADWVERDAEYDNHLPPSMAQVHAERDAKEEQKEKELREDDLPF